MTGTIQQFPHCDQRILHAPGECEYCDAQPEWQELRKHWGVAFTGHEPKTNDHSKELPCPADFNRGDNHKSWSGNVARPVGSETIDPLSSAALQATLASIPTTKAEDPRRSTTDGVIPGFENAAAPGPMKDNGQHSSYWILSDEERAKGFVRPYRDIYYHRVCHSTTRMASKIAETYAASPEFYTQTFCVRCKGHFPVGESGEFVWLDERGFPIEERVGT